VHVLTIFMRGVPFVLIGALVGCGGGRGRNNQAQEVSPLKPIATFYGNYVNQHQGRPPPSEAEFKAFLQQPDNSKRLQAEFPQVTDVDKLLISPRDNQPYVIFYGAIAKGSGPGGGPVVAYEKVGVSGKRFVVGSMGSVEEIDEATFRKMVPGAQ